VGILIVANPCAALDFTSTEAIHAEIMDQRNRGVAVLLVSEDLDEILELADRVVVMSGGRITYAAPIADTDRATIGHYMAGEKTAEAGVWPRGSMRAERPHGVAENSTAAQVSRCLFSVRQSI
jgi:ABC-type sugar transport system ATPase subunit